MDRYPSGWEDTAPNGVFLSTIQHNGTKTDAYSETVNRVLGHAKDNYGCFDPFGGVGVAMTRLKDLIGQGKLVG